MQSDDVCVTGSTFTLTRAPSPAPCPAADVIVPPPARTCTRTHTQIHKHTHGTSLLFHSPLAATFRCLHFSYCPKNNTRHLVRHIEYTHAHTRSHTCKHRPNLTLNANLTSSVRCVGLHRLMCTHRAKSWNCVIAATHKHILLVLNKGAFRFLKQDGSSVS